MEVKGLYNLIDLLLSMGHEFFAVVGQGVQDTSAKDMRYKEAKSWQSLSAKPWSIAGTAEGAVLPVLGDC